MPLPGEIDPDADPAAVAEAGGTDELTADELESLAAQALEAALEARGHVVAINTLTSGLSVIEVGDDVLIGGADQRRDGAVGGR